jgi:hypothetical protein
MSPHKIADHLLRTDQLAQMEKAIATLGNRLEQCKQNQKKQLPLLDSVSRGLYDEIDKLGKKAPAEPVTDLALAQINDVIRETKQLFDSDPYIQRLNEFVAAGDNPQHRDAVLVLRQIRQGLDRFRNYIGSLIDLLNSRLQEAEGIRIVIQLYLEEGGPIAYEHLEEYEVDLPLKWFSDDEHTMFDFSELDRTNIKEYFAEAKLP